MKESRHTRLCLERDVNREQHRHSNKSYGTTSGQRSQPGATAKSSGPSYESYSRTTQDQGRSHRGIHMTTWHHQPRLVCTRSLQHESRPSNKEKAPTRNNRRQNTIRQPGVAVGKTLPSRKPSPFCFFLNLKPSLGFFHLKQLIGKNPP